MCYRLGVYNNVKRIYAGQRHSAAFCPIAHDQKRAETAYMQPLHINTLYRTRVRIY